VAGGWRIQSIGEYKAKITAYSFAMISTASELRSRVEAALENRIPRALTPPQRSTPEMMPTGIASVDALTGGVSLGCLTEICGQASSGRTSVLLALIAECIRRDEICALVDASDAFDPQSAASAGIDLARLLWVRCGKKSGDRATPPQQPQQQRLLGTSVIGSSGEVKSDFVVPDAFARNSFAVPIRSGRKNTTPYNRRKSSRYLASPDDPITRSPDSSVEQALKATDLLLQAGGFGLVILDLADISVSAARRIPLTTWFRFRRTVENTSTALVIVEQQPHAKTCASLVMDFAAQQATWSEAPETGGTTMSAHSGESVRDGVSFSVTSEGVAIPFDKPMASSFEMPQRWNTPRARLLNTVHVYLQVARTRGIQRIQKFPTQSEHYMHFHHGDRHRVIG
jgi:recombination protein RecA